MIHAYLGLLVCAHEESEQRSGEGKDGALVAEHLHEVEEDLRRVALERDGVGQACVLANVE